MILRTLFKSIALGTLLLTSAPSLLAAQRKALGVTRNSHDRIARNSKARTEFRNKSGYPHGRPGYVIDHVVPLSRGGTDSPSNMQWQTKAEAKAKDRWERGGSHASTYRSRSYSRKSYAPRHRSPRSSYRNYRAPTNRSHSYHRSSHRRK